MLATQLTAIASDFNIPDAIEAIDSLYADSDNTPELIKSAFREVPRYLQSRLKDIFMDREALGEFKIGDLVMIRSESTNCEPDINGEINSFEICFYSSLKDAVLTIDHIDYPWIACKRPSGTTAPGLLKTDITKYRLWPQ